MSGLYNSFLGQTRSQARLNAIASYDQSNELFKVRHSLFPIAFDLQLKDAMSSGVPKQRDDVLM